jgi:hypothetical protein
MKVFKYLGIILVFSYMQGTAAPSTDTSWLCRNTTPEVMWIEMFLADTFPDNRGQFSMVDTGDAIDGPYVNFDYQFGNPHPGYAGFKFYWDNGNMMFWVDDFDSLILWHKGPLPGHKVKMIWAQGSAGCGTPINYQTFGEYKSSTQWKRESLPFPEKRGDVSEFPDSPFVKNGLFELRMLIYNDSTTGTTSPTSAPGNLKVDNMFFLKKSSSVRTPEIVPKAVGNSRFFMPRVSGKVILSIYSLQGQLLFKKPVDVTAGTRYDVLKFARKKSSLSAGSIHTIHIRGAGVNIIRNIPVDR